MVNRRIIRVKVMQQLYALEMRGYKDAQAFPDRELKKKFDEVSELFLYILKFMAQMVRLLAKTNPSKPFVDEVGNVLSQPTSLSTNPIFLNFEQSEYFTKGFYKKGPENIDGNSLLKKVCLELSNTQEYKDYLANPAPEKKAHKEILAFIFNDILLSNEEFQQHTEDIFYHWDDDTDFLVQLFHEFIDKPVNYHEKKIISEDKWQFAHKLLKTVMDKNDFLKEFIQPKLVNWEMDRIPVLDLIILQMGIAEFLYFETIPTKVTINEYVDLAKYYSTQQSWHFVNAVLDGILKELEEANRLVKISHKAI